MGEKNHSEVAAGSIHGPFNLSYADQTARLAATGFTADNLYNFAVVTVDDSIWMLTQISPPLWSSIPSTPEVP